MGWIVTIACIALLVVVLRKSLDRETAKNFNRIGKALLVAALLLVAAFVVEAMTHGTHS